MPRNQRKQLRAKSAPPPGTTKIYRPVPSGATGSPSAAATSESSKKKKARRQTATRRGFSFPIWSENSLDVVFRWLWQLNPYHEFRLWDTCMDSLHIDHACREHSLHELHHRSGFWVLWILHGEEDAVFGGCEVDQWQGFVKQMKTYFVKKRRGRRLHRRALAVYIRIKRSLSCRHQVKNL